MQILFILIVLLALIYFPTKYVAEYFGAERTGFWAILLTLIINGFITQAVGSFIDNKLITFVIMLGIGGLLFQHILSAASYRQGFVISLLSQVAILVCFLVFAGTYSVVAT
ncbi:hypothetical protein BS636_05490 [Acinetobacter sp. LoGeW2-3]|uniref:hypothetical protein n=1 Tax=Acinetobacter sp. LoGeW2-3 TaxID=1808001 RepID=UPI000C05C2A1|nr:hypothetical protein [Acinetobacter sp. LoGeW2-3]ATO19149.1 hypothetical protein BS636_05490 [Acinetobacter sp. LoGeW2-3]